MGKLCRLLKPGSNILILDTEENDIRWTDLLRVSSCFDLTAKLLATFFQDQALLVKMLGPFRFIVQKPEV